MHRHTQGLLHRSERVKALLRKDCITQSEIAARVGVTRERVRQIAQHFEFATGTQRRAVCRINKARHRVFASPLFAGFREACKQRSLSAEPLPLHSDLRSFQLRAALVNDLKVALKVSSYNVRGYCCISSVRRSVLKRFEVFAYLLPDKRWLLLPRELAPTFPTMFALEPNLDGIGITNERRHDYHNFIDAWHLLEAQPRAICA
jgi:hypothetical protein